MDQQRGPIGVFDSGVGGLAVLWELRRRLPAEDIHYFADQAHFPYGVRTATDVRRLSIEAGDRLVAEGAKLLVVACNTASSAALPVMRQRFGVPVVGIEPAVKPACAITRCGRIGVLATGGTAQGMALKGLIERVAGGVEVITVAAGELVGLVERGDAFTVEAEHVLDGALAMLRDARVDVVVLGCTHFAFLKASVVRYMGAGVTVLEPTGAVALRAVDVLRGHGLARPDGVRGTTRYRSSAGDARILGAAQALMRQTGMTATLWTRPGNQR